MRSKADISQLNLPHGTNNKKVEKQKNYKVEMDMLYKGYFGFGSPYSFRDGLD